MIQRDVIIFQVLKNLQIVTVNTHYLPCKPLGWTCILGLTPGDPICIMRNAGLWAAQFRTHGHQCGQGYGLMHVNAAHEYDVRFGVYMCRREAHRPFEMILS